MEKLKDKTKSDVALSDLELFMLPGSERTLTYRGEFVLSDNFVGTDVYDATRFISSPYPFKMCFTLGLFCTQGCLRVRLNLTEYRVCRGDVLFVLPGSIGECLELSADCRLGLVAYTGQRYQPLVDSDMAMSFRQFLVKQACIHLSEDELHEVLAIYGLMRAKLQQPRCAFVRESLVGYMQALASINFQWLHDYHHRQTQKSDKGRRQQLFECFLDLVRQHYGKEREMAFYADCMCLTPKYLSSVIYQVSGRHASEWIRDYVVLEAKALLKSRRYTVQQVSGMLNFSNPSFFGKYFKAAVGCSPRRYMLE